jgi:hypothetical protein
MKQVIEKKILINFLLHSPELVDVEQLLRVIEARKVVQKEVKEN